MSENIFSELEWRRLLFDHTEGSKDLLSGRKITLYNGFDPTADSLHVGHFVPLMGLARMQRFGHTPIALAGGGTGMIGDPSGRSEERNLLSVEQIEANVAGIRGQMAAVLDFEVKSNPAKIVNNADWLTPLTMMNFLRDVGKHFTINYMLAKDSVKSRLDRDDGGISFTEFSYMLLQAYDFYELFRREGCVMQAGGSDQLGNITAGIQLIRKLTGEQAYGLAYPLITKSDGSKFGKTGTGTVWLDPNKTSPYRFYQFWLNADDRDVVNYLKFFTWLDRPEIDAMAHKVETEPHKREAQRTLAELMTATIHGPTALTRAQQASEVLFGGELDGLSGDDIADIFAEVPSSELAKAVLDNGGLPMVDLLTDSGVASSKGDARRSIDGGGIYLNNQRVEAADAVVTSGQLIDGRFLVLRKGRKKYHLVKVLA